MEPKLLFSAYFYNRVNGSFTDIFELTNGHTLVIVKPTLQAKKGLIIPDKKFIYLFQEKNVMVISNYVHKFVAVFDKNSCMGDESRAVLEELLKE